MAPILEPDDEITDSIEEAMADALGDVSSHSATPEKPHAHVKSVAPPPIPAAETIPLNTIINDSVSKSSAPTTDGITLAPNGNEGSDQKWTLQEMMVIFYLSEVGNGTRRSVAPPSLEPESGQQSPSESNGTCSRKRKFNGGNANNSTRPPAKKARTQPPGSQGTGMRTIEMLEEDEYMACMGLVKLQGPVLKIRGPPTWRLWNLYPCPIAAPKADKQNSALSVVDRQNEELRGYRQALARMAAESARRAAVPAHTPIEACERCSRYGIACGSTPNSPWGINCIHARTTCTTHQRNTALMPPQPNGSPGSKRVQDRRESGVGGMGTPPQ